MLILAIETATQSVGVALANERGVVAHLEVRQGRRHAETVVPAVEQLLAHAEASMAEITRIAVDVGPGLFTGLRVGVATAKAYALALDVPVVAISSLELVAREAAPAFAFPGFAVPGYAVPGFAERTLDVASVEFGASVQRFGTVIDARRRLRGAPHLMEDGAGDALEFDDRWQSAVGRNNRLATGIVAGNDAVDGG